MKRIPKEIRLHRRNPLLLNAALIAAAILFSCSPRLLAENAYYVATNGNDLNDGLSLEAPFQTIQKAFTEVIAGDSVYILEGVYREQVNIVTGGTLANPITVSAYTSNVVIKGSDVVTGWTEVDAVNHIWKKTNWTINTQQVFVHADPEFSNTDEGYILQQIGMPSNNKTTSPYGKDTYHFAVGHNFEAPPLGFGPNVVSNISYFPDGSANPAEQGVHYYVPEVDATNYMAGNSGTFYYSSPNSTLYVRLADNSNPNNRGIEASVRNNVLFPKVGEGFFKIFNIGFRHSNRTANYEGGYMVESGNYSVYENCDIQWADWGGIFLGSYGIATNCVLSNNGNNGGGGLTNIVFTDCTISSNNYRLFHHGNHAGGLKIIGGDVAFGVGGSSAVVEDCEVSWNRGYGVWFDWCRNGETNIVRNNNVHNNGSGGIRLEASQNGLIYNNLVISNYSLGIEISGSDRMQIFNNTIAETVADTVLNNAGILMAGLPRAAEYGVSPTLSSNLILNNILFNNRCIRDINYMTNGSTDVFSNFSDFNCFYRDGATPSLGASAISLYDSITNIQTFYAATGFEGNSLSVHPNFSVGSGEDFRLKKSCLLIDRGTNIAAVVDDYVGTSRPLQLTHDIGAFENLGYTKGDFNLDRHTDLLWRNYTTGSNLVWYMNTTNLSSFEYIPSQLNMNYEIRGTADFTGDCNNDLVWRLNGATNNAFWFMESTNFIESVLFQQAGVAWDMAGTGDFNFDGKADIIWRNYTTGSNVVWFMDGTNFMEAVQFPGTTNLTWHLVGTGDFNQDGKDDLLWRFYGNDGIRNGNNAIWHMDGTNLISSVSIDPRTNLDWEVQAVGDFNMDAKPDIVWRNMATGANQIWLMDNTNRLDIVTLDTVANLSWQIVGPK